MASPHSIESNRIVGFLPAPSGPTFLTQLQRAVMDVNNQVFPRLSPQILRGRIDPDRGEFTEQRAGQCPQFVRFAEEAIGIRALTRIVLGQKELDSLCDSTALTYFGSGEVYPPRPIFGIVQVL